MLHGPPASSLRLWTGSQPAQLALAEAELLFFGVRAPREERAELVVVPESEPILSEGVDALLRYTDPGTTS
ncbi:hypothetical protein [Streptomyces antibioticus]|uniref:hypothetical protein n=1 Tax=Streptomyces antibioticus TaxID=1890 RepID=UPI0036A62EE4